MLSLTKVPFLTFSIGTSTLGYTDPTAVFSIDYCIVPCSCTKHRMIGSHRTAIGPTAVLVLTYRYCCRAAVGRYSKDPALNISLDLIAQQMSDRGSVDAVARAPKPRRLSGKLALRWRMLSAMT